MFITEKKGIIKNKKRMIREVRNIVMYFSSVIICIKATVFNLTIIEKKNVEAIPKYIKC